MKDGQIVGFLMRTRSSLRTKIIAWSFVPTVIILTTVALVTFYSYQQVTRDLVLSQSAEVARYKSNQVENILSEIINPLMYDYIFFLDTGKDLNIFDRAKNLEGSNLYDDMFSGNIIFLDANGKVIFSETHPEWVGVNWGYRDFFREAKQNIGINVIIGQLMEDRRSGDFLLPFAIHLRDANGQFAGIAVLYLNIKADQSSSFYDALESLFSNQKVMIVDASQRVIFHSDLGLIGQKISEQEEFNSSV